MLRWKQVACQGGWVVSSIESRLIILSGLKGIPRDSRPEIYVAEVPEDSSDPYSFDSFPFIRDLVYLDKSGRPLATRPIRGLWDYEASKFMRQLLNMTETDVRACHGRGVLPHVQREFRRMLKRDQRLTVSQGRFPIEGGNFFRTQVGKTPVSLIGIQSVYLTLFDRHCSSTSKCIATIGKISTFSDTSDLKRSKDLEQPDIAMGNRFADILISRSGYTPTEDHSRFKFEASKWLHARLNQLKREIQGEVGSCIFLEAMDYHLDVCMSVSPDGQIYIDDPRLALDTLKKTASLCTDPALYRHLYETLTDRISQIGPSIDRNIMALISAGFDVIRVPSRFGEYEPLDEFPHVFEFMGGVFVSDSSSSSKHAYITTGPSTSMHEFGDALATVFKSFMTNTRFLGAMDSQDLVSRLKARLHCIAILLPLIQAAQTKSKTGG